MTQGRSSILFLLGLVLLISACSKSDELPDQILPTGKMSAILLDLQLAKSYNYAYYPKSDTVYPVDTKKRLKVFYQQIFQLHKVDTATFLKSFRYYSTHPDKLKIIYNAIQDSLDKKIARTNDLEEKRRKAEIKRREAGLPVHTEWQEYFKTWRSFSDSINRQSSRPAIFIPPKLSANPSDLRVAQ